MSRTGRAAGPTAVPGVGLLLSDLMSRPRACLVATAPSRISATTIPITSSPPAAAKMSTTAPASASTASTAARVRRIPARVTA